ncbi:MAG: clostripain-related cysteine peptidase [Planctomycetaceae bacterium]
MAGIPRTHVSRRAARGRRARATFERLESRALLAVAPLPAVSIADASVTEGNSGTRTIAFTVGLSAPAKSPAMVRFATSNGTATTAGGDYVAKSGWATIGVGKSQATVTVTVRGDTVVEADETFRVTLSSPIGCTLGQATATGTILNDDAPPTSPGPGSWTILVYMTGENLNSYARADINEMEKALAGMPAGVRFVVSWDQPKLGVGTAYATGGGTQAAWRTYGRSVLTADTTSTIASTFDLSPGERNTGDPATLVDFVTWGIAQAPADHYVLQMWGHGGGLDGSQFDSESGGDALTIPEMAAALGAPGVPAFDVVSYDNCLMAMAEIGAAIAPKPGGVYVASEEVINGPGQDYTTAFSALKVADPGQVTAAQVAAGMVTSYGTQYLNDWGQCDTFSATSAAGYASFTAAIRDFVTASAALASGDRAAVRAAADGSIAYDVSSFVDVGSFMGRVAATASLPAALRTAASGVTSALASLVTSKTADQRGSSGLSIYLPTWADDPSLATYATDAAAFCAATGWNSFATWLATGTRSAAAPTAGLAPTKARHGDPAISAAAFAALASGETHAPSPRRGAARRAG